MATARRPAGDTRTARGAAPRPASGRLTRSHALLGAAAAALLIIGIPAVAAAQDAPSAADLKRGEELLTKNCGQCHAVGRSGNSPRPEAPAFRVLGQRYPIDSLEESLGEGIMSGHPDMPEISFESDDVGAIIDYLNAIQVKR